MLIKHVMFDISPRTVLFRMTFQIACIESGKIIIAAFIWLVSGMYEHSNVTSNHSDQSRFSHTGDTMPSDL